MTAKFTKEGWCHSLQDLKEKKNPPQMFEDLISRVVKKYFLHVFVSGSCKDHQHQHPHQHQQKKKKTAFITC